MIKRAELWPVGIRWRPRRLWPTTQKSCMESIPEFRHQSHFPPHQLDYTYHIDIILKGRLITAVETPTNHVSLVDRMPRNSPQAVKGVSNQLKDKKKSAGKNRAFWITDDWVNYSLGSNYGGSTKCTTKKPCYTAKNPRRAHPGILRWPEWLKWLKVWFLCVKPQIANNLHSTEVVTKDVEKLKAMHPHALLTVEDLVAVVLMTA